MTMQPRSTHSAGNALAPAHIRVLVVDSKAASRLSVVQLLRDCQYQASMRGWKTASNFF